EIGGRDRRVLWQISRNQQEPLAVFSENQIRLAFGKPEALSLVATHNDREDDTTLQGEDADTVNALEAHQSIIERHGCVLAEPRLDGFITFVCFTDLSNASDSHLSRQPEPLPKFCIISLLQKNLIGGLKLKSIRGKPVGGLVETLDGLAQLRGLMFVWE